MFPLTDHISIALIPLNTFKEDIELMQLIEGSYDSKTYTYQSVLRINPREIQAAAFSPLGNNVYQISYEENILTYESLMEMTETAALNMLADIQFCYYDEDIIKTNLINTGLDFVQIEDDKGWTRTISDNENIIIEIHRQENHLEYRNSLRNYSYVIEEWLP